MAFKTEDQQETSYDWLKWFIITFLLVAGIIVSYYYNNQPWPMRVLGWLFLMAIIVGVTSQTRLGKLAIDFASESRMELRKVYWPTRQETIQTTLFVIAMVIVLAIILWGADAILMWLIGWLTGQRG